MDYDQNFKIYAPEDISVCFNGEFIHPFPEGFRPAKYIMQRDQYGDHCVIVKADDSAYNGKFDFDPYAHVRELMTDYAEWIDAPPETFLNNSPRVPDNGPIPPYTNNPLPPYVPNTPDPWTPPKYPPFKPPYVCNPMFEKCDVVVPPIDPQPPIDPNNPAPVPLPESMGLLLAGMVILARFRKNKS